MKNKLAFTLIEVLLVLATIGLITALATVAYNQTRAKSRDHKRTSDIILLQQVLESYHRQEGSYPSTLTPGQPLIGSSGVTYLASIPEPPTPADGDCATDTYNYQVASNNQGYGLEFCLGGKVGGLTNGINCATQNDIASGSCFVCGDSVSYGGESYPTVLINTQCWFAKNLNIGTKIDSASSAPCVDVTSGSNWWSCQVNPNTIEKYCYDNDDSYCITDGGLYEWAEALGLPYDCNNANSTDNGDGTYALSCPISGSQTISAQQQGICPTGWHIPTFSEMQTLAQNADLGCDLNCNDGACNCSSAGGKLKATGSHSPISWNGTDDYNFSALPAGGRDVSNLFSNRGGGTSLCSSLPFLNPYYTWAGYLGSGGNTFNGIIEGRAFGVSVRCLKDTTTPTPPLPQ